jgi:hypothetical protein
MVGTRPAEDNATLNGPGHRRPRNRPRCAWAAWLVALYGLATFLADGAHSHARGHGHLPTAREGCDDPGVYWVAHTDTPDLSSPADPCAACQYRAAYQYWLAPGRSAPPIRSRDEVRTARLVVLPRLHVPITGRGPPLA